MRPLTDEELKIFFEKLAQYIGRSIKLLIERKDEPWAFRIHKSRVYYMPESLLRQAAPVAKKQLVSVGTCFGKFSASMKFKCERGGAFSRLHITALPHIAQYAKYKVWVKPGSEMSFLYGNHLIKSGLGRITDNTPQYQGVVVYTMGDIPIGFGATARSTTDARRLDPTEIVVFHQCDAGEYLRSETELF